MEDLPTVKYFLDKVDERDRKYPYQNVTLPFVQATKESAKRSNNMLLAVILKRLCRPG